MESHVFKKHFVKDISREFPYACRFRPDTATVKASLARHGMISPVVVFEGKGAPVLITGHARFQAALELGWNEIPVLSVTAEKKPREWFLFSLLSNWNQNWADLDRASAIHRARGFGFSENEMLEDILPALGLAPEKRWLDESAEIMALAPEVLNAVADGRLPYRGVRSLAVFSAPDQKAFVYRLAGPLSLTSNQLIKTSEWLNDLLKSRKQSMETLLASPDVEKVTAHREWNPRQKGELFYHKMRSLRFPQQVSREEEFVSAADRLAQEARQDKSDLSLEAPPFFEAEGITLRARLKDTEALDRMMEVIRKKRNLFNSLFDIVL